MGVRILLSTALALHLGHNFAHAQFSFRTIALTHTDGQFGPDLGAGSIYTAFGDSPVLNESGEVSFLGHAVTPNNSTLEGFWSNAGSTNTPIALTGEEGPLGPGLGSGIVFDNFVQEPMQSDGQHRVFGGFLKGSGVDGTNDWVWVRHTGGGILPFARAGVDASLGPGLGSQIVHEFFIVSPPVDVDGRVGYGASLAGPAVDSLNNQGLWINSGTGNVLFARTGSSGTLGPSLENDVVFSRLLSSMLHGTEEATFAGAVTNQVGINERVGIWRFNGTANTPLVLNGSTDHLGPGLGASLSFINESLGTITSLFDVNSEGATVFTSLISDQRRGVWLNDGSVNRPIALAGESGSLGPGLGPNRHFATNYFINAFRVPTLNDEGSILFQSRLQETNQFGLWLNKGDDNRLIALTGVSDEFGPGLGPGIMFTELRHTAINSRGMIVFNADLNIGSPTNSNKGLWAYIKGKIQPIIISGQTLDVDSTAAINLKTVEWVGMEVPFAGDANGMSFNERGELAFRMGFTDGSYGVFLVHLIPEPSSVTIALAAICLPAVCSRQRNPRRFS